MTAIAIALCGSAGAEPAAAPGGMVAAHPAGWRHLPEIARAVAAATAGKGVALDAADAWGEPAAGCHAVWLALHGGTASAPVLAEQVLGSVAALSPADLARPTAPEGVLAFSFARPPYRGRVRARLGAGRISAVACFGDGREPDACDAACRGVLEGAP